MKRFRILVLDGGGSKGIYTLGVLSELELALGGRLSEHFDLIYGTSSGSIIGSLLALESDIPYIKSVYIDYIPEIMKQKSKEAKSEKLSKLGDKVFGSLTFNDFATDVGIVALNYETQNPLIFKSNVKQAHGMIHSFVPGFGCTISDAVQASCSAYPVFSTKILDTLNYGSIVAIDGGFVANNATLFALIDADKAFQVPSSAIRVLSIGTGNYIEKPVSKKASFFRKFEIGRVIERVISSSTNTNVILANLLYKHIEMVRVNNTYNEPEYSTNMVETDTKKLENLYQLGKFSYAEKEDEIRKLVK